MSDEMTHGIAKPGIAKPGVAKPGVAEPGVADRATELRAMGIGHELLTSDSELVEMVDLLIDIGVPLESMPGSDLTFLGAAQMIRPDARIEPSLAFPSDGPEADFRSKAALALGFNIDEDTRMLTPAEVDTIEFFNTMREIIGDDDMLALQRVLGSAMGKIARSVLSSLRLHYETPVLEESGSLVEVFRAYRAINEDMLPLFLDAAATVLRRHIAVASSSPNLWAVDGNYAGTMERTAVGFVDLVGFTSFTEKANLEQFVEALRSFESRAQEIIVENSGTLVKLIGDEIMFTAPTASAAIKIARQLSNIALGDTGPGSVRIGLSAGEVVAVGGDFYGTVVNIASRAVQQAEPDQIVVTGEITQGAHASSRFESIGQRNLRGISEPVALFRLL